MTALVAGIACKRKLIAHCCKFGKKNDLSYLKQLYSSSRDKVEQDAILLSHLDVSLQTQQATGWRQRENMTGRRDKILATVQKEDQTVMASFMIIFYK